MRRPPRSPLFPYTTLFRSCPPRRRRPLRRPLRRRDRRRRHRRRLLHPRVRSEEQTSELQSLTKFVCRLVLEKIKKYFFELQHPKYLPRHSSVFSVVGSLYA